MFCTGMAFGKWTQVQARTSTCAIIGGWTSSKMVAIRSRKSFWRETLCVFLLCLLPWVEAAGQGRRAAEKQEQAEGWIKENYLAVVDLIAREKSCVPTDDAKSEHAANKSSAAMRWSVCVRIIPGHPEELESLLWLEKLSDGSLQARIVGPRGASIYWQLVKLKAARRDASPVELAKLVAVETRERDRKTLPGLTQLASEFEEIRLSPVLSDELMMDPTVYSIRARSMWGEQMDLVLSGPGPSAPHQPGPLLDWVEKLRRVFSQ